MYWGKSLTWNRASAVAEARPRRRAPRLRNKRCKRKSPASSRALLRLEVFRWLGFPGLKKPLLFLETVQRGENLLAVLGGFYASPHLDDLAVGINQKRVAVGDHVIAQGP